MKIKVFLGLCLMLIGLGITKLPASAQQHVLIEQPNNLGMIKVLLCKDVEAANLEVRGGYKIFDPKSRIRVAKGVLNKQYLLRPTLDGIAWGESYPGVFQVVITPKEKEGFFLVNGIQYAGNLYVYQVGDKINLVNEVPIEEYVKSMLNPQVNVKMDSEVLSALAIIERTRAYYQSLKNANAFYHLDAESVGYQGRSVCNRNNGVDKAVEFTRFLVMKSKTYGIENGFFNASFTQHCAGKTAPFHLIYRREGHASRKPVESVIALDNRAATRWVTKMSCADLAHIFDLEEIKNFEVFQDEASGKVYGVKFFDKNQSVDLDFPKLHAALGADKIKSSDFELKQKDGYLIFEGYGEGSGVGACLYTMQQLAARGRSADEILSHFFPSTQITFMGVQKTKK